MLRKWFATPIACLVLLMATGAVPSIALESAPAAEVGVSQADARFRVIYRCEYLDEDETTRSGLAVVAVVNRSGQVAQEVSARIPELSDTPFGHFPILFGEVADGQAKEVVAPFTTFKSEIVEMAESVVWQIELVDPSGTPMTVEVQGEMSL